MKGSRARCAGSKQLALRAVSQWLFFQDGHTKIAGLDTLDDAQLEDLYDHKCAHLLSERGAAGP